MNSGPDRADFDRLAAPLRAGLEAHCYRMLGSVQDAEDAVQESLLRAWRARERFEPNGSFRAWLYTIATNRCLTMIETRQRRELPVDLTPGAPSAESAWVEPFPDGRLGAAAQPVGPEARYEAFESIELAFVAALQQLPGRQRAVLVLRDVLGYSAREVADLLETTVAAANSALQRARGVLDSRLPATSQQRTMQELGDESVRNVARRYALAWESGDVDAIVAMLSADAKYSMPPLSEWYEGPAAIRDFIITGPLAWRWRFVPARANGQLAFGTYQWVEEQGRYRALGLDLLALRGEEVVEVVSYLLPEIFGRFGLPDELPADR